MILRIWTFVILCALAIPALRGDEQIAFDKLIALEGKEFVTAADQAGDRVFGSVDIYTVDQLIAVAEKLLPTIRPYGDRPADYELSPFHFYFEPACERANDEQLDKLIGLYRRLDPNTFEKSNCLPALGSRILARQIATTPSQHLRLPENDEALLPAESEAAPEDLRDAWRLFHRAEAAFEKAFAKPREVIEVSANMKSFYNLIGDALSGVGGKEHDVRPFAWTGANCLDITDIEDAQNLALLLMLLRDGRTDEAVGAALKVAGTTGSTSDPEPYAKPVIDLLERCGLDWEEIFAGGQAETETRRWSNYRAPYLTALARFGSPHAVPLVRQLAHFVKPENRTKYVAVFSAWIDTPSKSTNCEDEKVPLGRILSDNEKRAGRPMPPDVQTTVLHDAEEFATAACPEELAEYAINIFGRTQALTSIPALTALTRHRSSSVAKDAASILSVMGETAKFAADPGPIRFQILANGRPLPEDLDIAWQILSDGGYHSSSAHVQADGVIEVPRADFPTPERATEVELSRFEPVNGGVIFRTKLSPPWSFEHLTKIDLKVSSLEIALRNSDGLNAPPPDKAFMSIRPLPDYENSAADSFTRANLFRKSSEVIAKPTIRLPAIEEGEYEVWIGVPGAEIWRQIVRVGAENTRVEAKLNPGSDLSFKIIAPDGQRILWPTLLKDGEKMERGSDSQSRYRGLPCGKYVLRIPGSELFEKERVERKIKRGPDEITYKGREVSFTVEKGSPTLIDLGEIRLERAD